MHKIRRLILINEYYFFRIIFNFVDVLANSFYLILLFRTFGDINYIFVDALIFFIAQWIGFLAGGFLIGKSGYVNGFRISMAMIGISGLTIALLFNHFASLFVLFALIRGFPRGIFWSINGVYLVKELNQKERNLQISNNLSIQILISILLPLLLGLILSNRSDYISIFLISGLIAIASIFIPWNYNKKIINSVSIKEVKQILSNRRFSSYGTLISLNAAFEVGIFIAIGIIPFLFFKEELAVGLLTSGINLVAAAIVFLKRKAKIHKSIKQAYAGLFFNLLGNLAFIIFWTTPLLIVRGLISTIGGAFYTPLAQKIDLEIREKILAGNVNKSSIEMNMIVETLLTIGRVLFISILLIISSLLNNSDMIFKTIFLTSSLWGLIFINQGIKVIDRRIEKEESLEKALL